MALGKLIWYAKVEATKESTKATTVSIRGEDEGIVEGESRVKGRKKGI